MHYQVAQVRYKWPLSMIHQSAESPLYKGDSADWVSISLRICKNYKDTADCGFESRFVTNLTASSRIAFSSSVNGPQPLCASSHCNLSVLFLNFLSSMILVVFTVRQCKLFHDTLKESFLLLGLFVYLFGFHHDVQRNNEGPLIFAINRGWTGEAA